MVDGSDTHIGRAESDTLCISVARGQRVRIVAGPLEGTQAVVVKPQSNGRVIVRVDQGLYLEIQQYCLEKVRKIRRKS